MKKRRCLIPVNAFYEWPKEGKPPKQPYAFELSSGNLFAFAGIWDACKDGEGHWLQSYAIVTTEANELMARIHPRMPVILHSRDYDRWLNREEHRTATARSVATIRVGGYGDA
jgi:putative SOS response-associated peptidase YedK